MSNDVAILGVGMHPWGKWGRNFVEYGVVAAQAALADAGVEWSDIQFVSGGETVRTAGLRMYFIGIIRTPWRSRNECPRTTLQRLNELKRLLKTPALQRLRRF